MDERTKRVYLAALAGLLHDVGKFAQRAGWRSGKHAEVGGEFVQQHVPAQWHKGLYPVMCHHDKPLQGYETKVVALADRLSAGERVEEQTAQPKQLLSIFCRLEANGKETLKKQYWPLKPLALKRDVIFPDTERGADYADLWSEFERDAGTLRDAHAEGGDLATYLESMLLLMQRYTWCVPSAYYRSLPDVSLYDHSRTTAALAACFVRMDEAALDDLLRDSKQETDVALLVGGDISGVQDFIYTITAKGATSALRGRSFYLQLLTETVVRYVLRRLELPITNLIYQGGGRFYLLARAKDVERLTEIQQEVSRVLLAHHRGDLYLALGQVALAAADFYDGRISGKWNDLARALRQVKQRRFAELGQAGLNELFEPQGDGGDKKRQCQICGREHKDIVVEKRNVQDTEGVRKCKPCRSYEQLGDTLREATYLWLEELEPDVPDDPMKVQPGGWKEVLATLGLRARVAAHFEQIPNDGRGQRTILALKDEALDDLQPDTRTAVGRRFLVNVTPLITRSEIEKYADEIEEGQKPGDVKPFSVLEAQSTGIKRLGVLRMDVDNLGKLFAEGFGDEATLSRVAALSFAVSLYFEGWVGQIATELNEQAQRDDRGEVLYSIYSGGDDLFFVGSWDVVVELARRIRADLMRFAAHHPGIHASAGVALVGGKYPLYQAAQDAGAAEHTAKSLKWRDEQGEKRKKDAITFLNRTLPWERFCQKSGDDVGIDTAHALSHRLVQMVKPAKEGGEGAPRALLQRLIQLQQMYEEAAEDRRDRGEDLTQAGDEQVYWGPWMWRGHYALMRMAGKKTGDPWDTIRALAKSLKGDRFRAIEWIGLAARWADLLTR